MALADHIRLASARMLGHTNRTIVFSKVNGDTYLEPDAPEAERVLTPSLSRLLTQIDRPPAAFLNMVREQLTVTSFTGFVEKFMPGFYFCVEGGESIAAYLSRNKPVDGPALFFSLVGKLDWRKIPITEEHLLLQRVDKFIAQRGRVDSPSERVDRDASLFNCRLLVNREDLYRLAADLSDKFDRIKDEVALDRDSQATRNAINAYDQTANSFADKIKDLIAALPIIFVDVDLLGEKPLEPGREASDRPESGASDMNRMMDRLAAARRSAGDIGASLASALMSRDHGNGEDDASRKAASDARHFQRIYTDAVRDFLEVTTPLFEQILGMYLLFHEFPDRDRVFSPGDTRGEDPYAPEVIFANDYLADLCETRDAELRRVFEMTNAQAANQFRDSISFAVVPQAAPFRQPRPPARDRQPISIDDDLFTRIDAAQRFSVMRDSDTASSSVAYLDDITKIMDWGDAFGFQVLFSPEEKLLAERVGRGDLAEIERSYALESLTTRAEADALVLCVPDYPIVPPDGKLIVGRGPDGEDVAVKVPGLVIRSCYIAAGRLMANDVPECLEVSVRLAGRGDNTRVNSELPGVAVDLARYPFLREPDLPGCSSVPAGVLESLRAEHMPFAVFTPLPGPAACPPRTLRRDSPGLVPKYRHLHLFRQERHLIRLLRAANSMDGGTLPGDAGEAEAVLTNAIRAILDDPRWSRPSNAVNVFPGALEEDGCSVRHAGGSAYRFTFHFRDTRLNEVTAEF